MSRGRRRNALAAPPPGAALTALADGRAAAITPFDLFRPREAEVARRRVLAKAGRQIPAGTAFSPGVTLGGSVVPGTLEKARGTPNPAFLRGMRHRSMIDQSIINIRLAQARHVAYRSPNPRRVLGWRVRHAMANEATFENTPEVTERCLRAEARVKQSLNPIWHPFGLERVIVAHVEDELVLDRKVIVYDALDSRDRPLGWHTLDPGTVVPMLQPILDAMSGIALAERLSVAQALARDDLRRRAIEQVSEQAGMDLSRAAYAQVIEGKVVGGWRQEEIALDVCYPTNEPNRFGWGSGPLEESLWWSLAFVRAVTYNNDLFNQNYPEAILFLYGDYDPEGLADFEKQLAGDSPAGTNFRLPVIPGGESMKTELQRLRETPHDMLFTQWIKILTSFKAACYRMNPELLNMDLVHGSDQTLFMSGNEEERVTLSQEEGFHSILLGLGAFYTRALIAPWDPDLVFEWVGMNAMTEQQEAQLCVARLAYMSPNEVRAKTGELPDLEGPDAEAGERLLNPVWVQIQGQQFQQELAQAQLKLQQQQLRAQQQAQAAQPPPSSPPAAGGREAPPSAGGRNHRTPSEQAPQARDRTSPGGGGAA